MYVRINFEYEKLKKRRSSVTENIKFYRIQVYILFMSDFTTQIDKCTVASTTMLGIDGVRQQQQLSTTLKPALFQCIRRIVIFFTISSLFTAVFVTIFLRINIPGDLFNHNRHHIRKHLSLSETVHSITVTRGIGVATPQNGCVSFHRATIFSEHREYAMVCLYDDSDQVQRVLFSPHKLGISGSLMADVGPDVLVTLLDKGEPVTSFFANDEIDLGTFNFGELEITWLKNQVFSDSQQIIVEVGSDKDVQSSFSNGIPASCVAFSGREDAASSLLICGAVGKDVVVLNSERFSDIGVDMRKLAREYPRVTMGKLAHGTFDFESELNGMTVEFSRGEIHDLKQKKFVDHLGIVRNLSENLGAFKLSFG